MKQVLKFFGIAVAVICMLSITISEKTVFSYIYEVISPATKLAQRGAISAYDYSAEQTSAFTKKLFENSVPKVDSVKSKLSSTRRAGSGAVGEPAELIEPQEKQQLDSLIKTHR